MLAVKFTARMDILAAAGPFMVAAVSDAATSLVSVTRRTARSTQP